MAILSNVNGKFAVDSTGAIQFSGQTGTSGYVLKSNGNAAPTWVDGSTVIGGPYLPLSGGTLTGATATASGISFTVGGILTTDKILVVKGQNLAHVTSSIIISQESTTKSQIRFYGADASTAGILEFMGTSSNGSVGNARLTLNADGSATFAGDVTLDNILLTPADIPAVNTPSICLRNSNNEVYFQAGSANVFNFIKADYGSILTLDGSTSATFGGDVKIAEASNKGQLFFGTANTDYEIKGGGNYGYLSLNAPILRFDTGGTERMRITSGGTIKMTDENGGVPILQARNYSVAATGAFTNNYAMEFRGATTTGAASGMMLLHNNEINDTRPTLDVSDGNGIFARFTNGKVGIGTTSIGAKLHVLDSNFPQVRINDQTAGGESGIRMRSYNGSTNDLHGDIFVDASSGIENGRMAFRIPWNVEEKLTILSSGFVGIGTTVPSGKLMISDANNRTFSDAQFKIEGNGYTAVHYLDGTEYMIQQNSTQRRIRIMSGTTNGVLLNAGATAWTSASDETLKENIKPLENVLNKIKNYRCVEYNFKNDKGKKIGFIAQDWVDDFAPIVDKDDNGLLGMKYTETIPVLLKAIQELEARIKILENK